MDSDRRRLLRSVAAVGTLGLAGCFSGDSGTPTDTGDEGPDTDTATPTATDRPTPTLTTIPGVRTDVPTLLTFDSATPEVAADD